MPFKFCWYVVLLLGVMFTPCERSIPGVGNRVCAAPVDLIASLESAVICEDIKGYTPQNTGIAFSITIGKVSCFSFFNPVPEKTFVYHNWYHRDDLSTKKKLFLQPPRWGIFSSIQLREADKGPWRVEITDQEGKILTILRFSITD
jgi:hypothetical protein